MYHKSLGIVLKKESVSEADKILHIYTSDLGRITAISKGANKLHARMLTATEPITESEFMFYTVSNTAVPKVIGGEIKNIFPLLKGDLKRYSLACRVAEIINSLTARYDKNEEKYQLLKRTMELLENSKNPKRIYVAFVLRFIKLCGYEPRIFKCTACGILLPLPKTNKALNLKEPAVSYFSLKEKGIICNSCHHTADNTNTKLTASHITYMQKLSRLSGNEIDNLELNDALDKSITNIVESYILEFLPYPLKSSLA